MPLTRELVLQIRAVNRAKGTLASVRSEIEKIHAATQALNTGQPIAGKGMKQVEQQAKDTGNEVKKLDKVVSKHTHTHKALNGALTKTSKSFDNQGREIKSLTRQMTHLRTSSAEVGKQVSMLRGFMDGLTNSTRVSAEGFGKMIANNVTWLAGFALISATIGAVIKLFSDLADRQNQFVKVSRLIATAVEGEGNQIRANAEAYQEFSKQLVITGRSAEDVAEAQYQLLSAGLSLEQVNQGLGPALNLIDAAMDDVTQTTKLLAGIMNNFGDTIYKTADGQVVFATASRALSEGLSDSVTEGEKMAAVSNLLAVAFDKHQAEVNELRDGLKFSIPAARAAGIGLDELTASLVTLEDHMIKSGRAGRSLRIMLAQIAKKPKEMEELFDTVFDPDEIDPFVSFLQRAGQEFDKIPDKAQKLAVAYEAFTTRGADAFLLLAGEADKLALNLEEIREKGKQVDKVMADIVRSSPERQFRRLWESVVSLVDAIGGNGLVKSVAQLAGEVADLITMFTKLEQDSARLFAAIGYGWDWVWAKLMGYKGGIREYVNEQLRVVQAEKDLKKSLEDSIKARETAGEEIKKAFEANKLYAASLEAVSRVIKSIKVGDDLASGLITAQEATKQLSEGFATIKDEVAFTKIGKDIEVFSEKILIAENKTELLGDFISNTVTVAVNGFQKATEAVSKFQAELKSIADETTKIKLEMVELGSKGATRLLSLANSLGLGANAGIKFLDSSKNLTEQITQLTEEYDKAFYAGAKSEKLIEIQDKINKLKKEETEAQEKSREAISIAVPLIEKQLQASEKLARVQQTQAKTQGDIAKDASNTAKERERASKAEQTALEKQVKALENAAKQQAKLSEIRYKQGYQDESAYQRDVTNIYEDTADKIERINRKIGNSQKVRLDIQIQKEKEAAGKLKEAQSALERYDGLIRNIAQVIKDANISDFANQIASAFKDAQPTIEDTKKEIIEIGDELDRLTSKTHTIKIRKEIETVNESRAMGGLAGYAAVTNVSAGEGFVPPSVVKHNLPTLQALNQGNAVPTSFPIDTFHGASGIDNIQTSLPAGSFVVSKRGMDALKRSSDRRQDTFDKKNFQLGGIVGGGSIGDRTQDDPGQSQTSRFDLVLNVGGEERRYPLTGQKTMINELATELERQNLVRL